MENHVYDAVLVVDLGDVYDVNCIHTSFEGASSADYTITFSTDNVTFSDPVPAFTVTNGIGMTNRHDWLTSEEAVKARYVKFHSTLPRHNMVQNYMSLKFIQTRSRS